VATALGDCLRSLRKSLREYQVTSYSRSLLDVMVQSLELIASVEIPDTDIWDVMGSSGLLLPRHDKTAVGMDIDALNVVVMAKEKLLAWLFLVKQLLVEYHANGTRVVHNLSHVSEAFVKSEIS